jgi:hypothetical protein
VDELAASAKLNPKVVRNELRLAFLCPEILDAILNGKRGCSLDAGNEVGLGMPSAITTAKMFFYHIVGYRNERLMRAFPALYSGLAAYPLGPFIGAGRGVAGSTRFSIFPPDGKDVGAASEQSSEKRHLFDCRGSSRFMEGGLLSCAGGRSTRIGVSRRHSSAARRSSSAARSAASEASRARIRASSFSASLIGLGG